MSMPQCEMCCERVADEIHPIHGPLCLRCKVEFTKHAQDLVAFVEDSPFGRTPKEIDDWIRGREIFENRGDQL